MAIHKFLLPLSVHQKDDVLMFPPGLQTYTATADADERWRAPARISPAAHYAIAVQTTDDKSGFGQPWDHRDTLSLSKEGGRNLIRRRHALYYLRSCIEFLRCVRRPRAPGKCHNKYDQQRNPCHRLLLYCSSHLHVLIIQHMAITLSTDCGGFLRTPDCVRRVVYNRHISIQQESRRSSSGITGCRISGWSPGRCSPFRIPEYRPDGTTL